MARLNISDRSFSRSFAWVIATIFDTLGLTRQLKSYVRLAERGSPRSELPLHVAATLQQCAVSLTHKFAAVVVR